MELSNVFTSNRQGGLNTAKALKPCLDAGKQNTLGSTKEYGLYEHSKETWNILGTYGVWLSFLKFFYFQVNWFRKSKYNNTLHKATYIPTSKQTHTLSLNLPLLTSCFHQTITPT